jgi:hypothetical protein
MMNRPSPLLKALWGMLTGLALCGCRPPAVPKVVPSEGHVNRAEIRQEVAKVGGAAEAEFLAEKGRAERTYHERLLEIDQHLAALRTRIAELPQPDQEVWSARLALLQHERNDLSQWVARLDAATKNEWHALRKEAEGAFKTAESSVLKAIGEINS